MTAAITREPWGALELLRASARTSPVLREAVDEVVAYVKANGSSGAASNADAASLLEDLRALRRAARLSPDADRDGNMIRYYEAAKRIEAFIRAASKGNP